MIDVDDAMKEVFDLAQELRINLRRVELTQALTLNSDKPRMGLKGSMGLFGSQEWWSAIRSGVMPLKRLSGVIEDAYYAGQDGTGPNNMVDITTDDGRLESIGIYLNDSSDVRFFEKGHRVEIVYALDELKDQPGPNGETNYSRIALKMAVSTKPTK